MKTSRFSISFLTFTISSTMYLPIVRSLILHHQTLPAISHDFCSILSPAHLQLPLKQFRIWEWPIHARGCHQEVQSVNSNAVILADPHSLIAAISVSMPLQMMTCPVPPPLDSDSIYKSLDQWAMLRSLKIWDWDQIQFLLYALLSND